MTRDQVLWWLAEAVRDYHWQVEHGGGAQELRFAEAEVERLSRAAIKLGCTTKLVADTIYKAGRL